MMSEKSMIFIPIKKTTFPFGSFSSSGHSSKRRYIREFNLPILYTSTSPECFPIYDILGTCYSLEANFKQDVDFGSKFEQDQDFRGLIPSRSQAFEIILGTNLSDSLKTH